MERLYEGMSIREVTDFLFVEDQPQEADLIFVFGGRHRERAYKAAELYKEGYANKIIFTGGDPHQTGVTEAVALRNVALAEGVSPEDVLVEEQSSNTTEHVRLGKEVLGATNLLPEIKSVLLVSSPLHLYRARMVFQKYFPNVQVFCIPDGRNDVNRDNWWHSEEGRRKVFRELEKVRDLSRRGEI